MSVNYSMIFISSFCLYLHLLTYMIIALSPFSYLVCRILIAAHTRTILLVIHIPFHWCLKSHIRYLSTKVILKRKHHPLKLVIIIPSLKISLLLSHSHHNSLLHTILNLVLIMVEGVVSRLLVWIIMSHFFIWVYSSTFYVTDLGIKVRTYWSTSWGTPTIFITIRSTDQIESNYSIFLLLLFAWVLVPNVGIRKIWLILG